MEKIIATRRLKDDPTGRSLIDSLDDHQDDLSLTDAILYYEFPVFRDYEEDIYRPNLMILSRNHGIMIFKFIKLDIFDENPEIIYDEDENLTQFYSILYGALIKSRRLRKSKQTLSIPINCFFYIPAFDESNLPDDEIENEIINSVELLLTTIKDFEVDEIPLDINAEARSIIEGAKAFATKPRRKKMSEQDKTSKAAILTELESEIANFDENQRRVAITLLDGPQRIKGLAGSGKTIVLAMKAAHIHLNYPEKKILFTFYTRSLYDFIQELVTKFYRHFKMKDPDWNMLHIQHAWGGRREEGVYYRTCIDNGISPMTYRDAYNRQHPFNYVCGDLLDKVKIKSKYDYIIIDEAQDFPQKFFRLCYFLAHGEKDEKSVIWAYDELQNIFSVKLKSTRELFGVDENGEPLIDLERAANELPTYLSNDVVLNKCYRNPGEILICAHALGFGIYGETIVQMLDDRDHWKDVGYEVVQGDFVEGSETIIERPKENSPLSISKYQTAEDLITYYCADSFDDEVKWVCDQIIYFLNEGLLPNDILVISLDDRNARSYFEKITSNLLKKEIYTNNILANPYASSKFWIEDNITLSTVYRAKGNESALVLAIGIDAIYKDRNNRIGRNKLFTTLTRTKAWLRISGTGDEAREFFQEIDKAMNNFPRLSFLFPDPKKVELLQRDLTARAVKLRALTEKYRKELSGLGFSDDELVDFFTLKEKK